MAENNDNISHEMTVKVGILGDFRTVARIVAT